MDHAVIRYLDGEYLGVAKLTSELGLDHKMTVLAALGRHPVFRGYKQLHARLLGCIGDGPLRWECAKCQCGDDDFHVVLPKDGRECLHVSIVHRGDFSTLKPGTLNRAAPRARECYNRGSAVYECLL